MRIDQIKICNFRSIRESVVDLSQFSCIVGQNNAGKSTILLALNLFINGTKLTSTDFYDPTSQVRIEVTFTGISTFDLNRLHPDHRSRIEPHIMDGGTLIFVRQYSTDGSSDLLCRILQPTDPRLNTTTFAEVLKGKKGAEIVLFCADLFPEYDGQFDDVRTQSDAKEVLEQIVSALPTDQLSLQDSPLWTGFPNSIKPLLPEPIYVPAVKDVNEEMKVKESANMGKLVKLLLEDIESAPEFERITSAFAELDQLLNGRKTMETPDHRLPQVRQAEQMIQGYIRENFPNVQLEMKISPPELKQVFSSAQLFLDDGVMTLVDGKGDGLKRAVIFALIRSYVEMRKARSTAENAAEVRSNYLFLFEEPELYLHPAAQLVLFDALSKLSDEHQVVTTTHSPLFFGPSQTTSFTKVIKKTPLDVVPYSQVTTVDLQHDLLARDAFQILCYENNAAAFFAERVLLVEGDSDMCYFQHVAKLLSPEWDFSSRNIPIIRIHGKGNVKRYREFFQKFDIEVHIILDLDALLSGFSALDIDNVQALSHRETLIQILDRQAAATNISVIPTREQVKEMVRQYSWTQRYTRLKELAGFVLEGKTELVTQEVVVELSQLFEKETYLTRREVMMMDDPSEIEGMLMLVLEALRDEEIYILCKGPIEEYYPPGVVGNDKPTKAMDACRRIQSRDEVIEICPQIVDNGKHLSELEAIFSRIFATGNTAVD